MRGIIRVSLLVELLPLQVEQEQEPLLPSAFGEES